MTSVNVSECLVQGYYYAMDNNATRLHVQQATYLHTELQDHNIEKPESGRNNDK